MTVNWPLVLKRDKIQRICEYGGVVHDTEFSIETSYRIPGHGGAEYVAVEMRSYYGFVSLGAALQAVLGEEDATRLINSMSFYAPLGGPTGGSPFATVYWSPHFLIVED